MISPGPFPSLYKREWFFRVPARAGAFTRCRASAADEGRKLQTLSVSWGVGIGIMHNAEVYEAFKIGFKAARDEVYRRCNNKFPLNDVIDMMVEAAYSNLLDVVAGKLILEGAMNGLSGKTPKEKILDKELIAKEILSILGTDLNLIDPKHEYAVGMVKHERRTKSL